MWGVDGPNRSDKATGVFEDSLSLSPPLSLSLSQMVVVISLTSNLAPWLV